MTDNRAQAIAITSTHFYPDPETEICHRFVHGAGHVELIITTEDCNVRFSMPTSNTSSNTVAQIQP